jgi:parvulin-like peptidyl-prolyl isomerase
VIEVHLAHILVQWQGLKRTRSERTRDEASERIAQAQALLENGTAFDAVAIEWSDGPFGARGGDLGWFQKGQMTPQFDEAAFALKPGERSGIVESMHGFHLIQRIE